MNNDQISGGLNQATGRLKDAGGALAGDPGVQISGKLRTAAGKAQSLYGDARHSIEHQVADKPIAAMAAIGAVGLAAGLLLGQARKLGQRNHH